MTLPPGVPPGSVRHVNKRTGGVYWDVNGVPDNKDKPEPETPSTNWNQRCKEIMRQNIRAMRSKTVHYSDGSTVHIDRMCGGGPVITGSSPKR